MSLDKLYTNKDIIKPIFNSQIKEHHKNFFFLEPSAGNGALVDILKEKEVEYAAFDILPERDDNEAKNFFHFNKKLDLTTKKKIITFMNPPFGKSCSLAIRFFNHSATFSSEIWQIVPKTFKKAIS